MKIKKLRKLYKAYQIKAEKDGACNLSGCWNVMVEHMMMSAASNRPSPNNGILKFLIDSANVNNGRFNIQQVVTNLNMEDGKKHKVISSFMPRKAPQTADGPGTGEICSTDGVMLKYKTDEKYIRFRHRSEKLVIDNAYLRCIKEGREVYRSEAVAQLLRTYLDAFGKAVANQFIKGGYIGKFARSGATCKPLYLYNGAGNSINPLGDIQLNEDMMNADMSLMPTLLGGTKLSAYAETRQFTLANLAGFEVTRIGQEFVPYRDTNISSVGVNGGAVVADRLIAVIPGAVKLVTATRETGDFSYERDTQLRGTIQDPFLGLTHDYYINETNCGEEVITTIQFAIDWDIIGYPSCWADEDPEFAGVTDVFCYEIQCSDLGVCSMETTTTDPFAPTKGDAPCNAYEACEQVCNAQFQNECAEFALFRTQGQSITSGLISGVSVNGMDFSLGGQFNLASNPDGTVTAIQAALASIASIKVVGGGDNGVDFQLDIVTSLSILSIKLLNDAGADIDLTRTVQYLQHVWDVSTPSTGATISALNWTAPDTTTFGGAPTDSLISVAGHYGTMQNFFANVNESGAYVEELTDSNNCESTYSASLEPCAGLEFSLKINVFGDTNDNDLKDLGETGLANVKILCYKGASSTELVDELVSDGGGDCNFMLEAGTYNFTIDPLFGAAVGRDITTALPKYVTIAVSGAISYGPQWSENGKMPVGPVL
jgi:hypothetical protein